jgi:hypothetical protein
VESCQAIDFKIVQVTASSYQMDKYETLIRSVEDEVKGYFLDLESGSKPSYSIRTNTKLGIELGRLCERKPYSKSYITKLLNRYLDADILELRQAELIFDNYLNTIGPLDKSAIGRNGGHNTKGIKKHGLTMEQIVERGRNGMKIRWRNHTKRK